MFVDKESLDSALLRLHATADHMIKIWFVLKHMGLRHGAPPVRVTTSNSTASLQRLFAFGAADNALFVPFAHTKRFKTMKGDAARSIIQTTVRRWASSGSVVTTDPTSFLDFGVDSTDSVHVSTARTYPVGLGVDKRGFAIDDGARASIPGAAFAVWYFRQMELSGEEVGEQHLLVNKLRDELGISDAEYQSVFVDDKLDYSFAKQPLSDADVFASCQRYLDEEVPSIATVVEASADAQERMVRSMTTISSAPSWLNFPPKDELRNVLDVGESAVLLFGPPRTGKTRAIHQYLADTEVNQDEVAYLQIHAGWSYENLMQMFAPDSSGKWGWRDGVLKAAIESGKKFVVLEEVNRTSLSQALGEVFSLIEHSYRGPSHAVTLRDGNPFFVPVDVVFLFTMNTVDKSTEDVDDALFGRIAAVEFPGRVEDLVSILKEEGVDNAVSRKYRTLFAAITEKYPLGHGYFAGSGAYPSVTSFYKSRIRPVLYSHFQAFDRDVLDNIDNVVDGLESE